MSNPTPVRPVSQLLAFVRFQGPKPKVQADSSIYGLFANGLIRGIQAGEWNNRSVIHPGVPEVWEDVSQLSSYQAYNAALRDAGTDD